MIINIEHEPSRLQPQPREWPEGYCPFVVHIYRDDRSRSPILVRRKTLQEAMAFVEDVTGLSAIKYHHTANGQLYAFTGSHQKRYGWTQYAHQPEPAALAR